MVEATVKTWRAFKKEGFVLPETGVNTKVPVKNKDRYVEMKAFGVDVAINGF